MNAWTKTVKSEEVADGKVKVVDVGQRSVMLLRACGELHAVDSTCPHMGLPLQIGRVDADCAFHCPWHRSAFDLKSGDVKDWAPWPPGLSRILGAIRRERALPVFAVKDEDGYIWVGEQTNRDDNINP